MDESRTRVTIRGRQSSSFEHAGGKRRKEEGDLGAEECGQRRGRGGGRPPPRGRRRGAPCRSSSRVERSGLVRTVDKEGKGGTEKVSGMAVNTSIKAAVASVHGETATLHATKVHGSPAPIDAGAA
jgi:hypothetical protein